jgi:hypothetical protein
MSQEDPVYIIVDAVELHGAEADLTGNNAVPKSYVDSKVLAAVNALVAQAPGTLDTLKEIADALGNDANLASVLTTSINNVQSAVTAEAATRSAADASFESKMAVEKSRVDSAFSTEASARDAADVSLSGRIDTESFNREQALAQLASSISETTDSLSGRIDTESMAREQSLAQLASSISETTDSLSSRITEEKSRAETEEAKKFDKAGGSVSGEVTLDSYLNFGPSWRVRGSAAGDKLVFEYKRAGVWRTGVPFIARQQ